MDNDNKIAEADSIANDNDTKCSQGNLSSLSTESLKNKKCIACDFYTINFDIMHHHQMSKHTSEELSYYIIKIQDPFFTRKSLSGDEEGPKNFPSIFHYSKANESNMRQSLMDAPLNFPPLRRPHQFLTAPKNNECNNDIVGTFNTTSSLKYKSKLNDKDSVFFKCANDLCGDLIKIKDNKLKKKRLNNKKHIHYNTTALMNQLRKPNINNISDVNGSDAVLQVPLNKTEKKFETVKMWALENDSNNETTTISPPTSIEIRDNETNVNTQLI